MNKVIPSLIAASLPLFVGWLLYYKMLEFHKEYVEEINSLNYSIKDLQKQIDTHSVKIDRSYSEVYNRGLNDVDDRFDRKNENKYYRRGDWIVEDRGNIRIYK